MLINVFTWPLAVRQRDDSMGEIDAWMMSIIFTQGQLETIHHLIKKQFILCAVNS